MRRISTTCLVLAGLLGCGGDGGPPGALDSGPGDGGGGGEADAGSGAFEHGLFVTNADGTGPIEWIPVDGAGLGARVTLASEIAGDTRQSVWGFSRDGAWLFYVVGEDPDQSLWTRHLGGEPQRLDDGSRPYWGALTHTGDTVFFVGESEVAFAAALGADGVAGEPLQVSREDKRVFAVPPAPSGDHVAMHYYGFGIPIVRVVQDMDALGEDRGECCAFGYYWNLVPRWANQSDRELMVAGPSYEDRHLYVIGIDDDEPTPVHIPDDHGGRYVVHGEWSAGDELIAYLTKMTFENFSNHLFIADVRGAPQRLEVTSAHTGGVSWRPGSNRRHLTYSEFPAPNSQQRLMLGTVSVDPLAFDAVPIVEHEPSDVFAILYEWNLDGTAILHHGGAGGAYTVTFVSPDGQVVHRPVGVHFREEDSEWSIPHIGWSKDGRRFICRTGTGYAVGSIDVDARTVGAVVDLPADIDFAWFDRRALPHR
jgi:hypothetical protein